MYLYHYSSEPREVIKSLRKSGTMTDKELEERNRKYSSPTSFGQYIDHISFFFDPIPSKLLPTIFPPSHKSWFHGNVLYEHQVDLRSMGTHVPYKLTEGFDETAMYLDYLDGTETVDSFLARRKRLMLKQKKMGDDVHDLLKIVVNHKGKTKGAFEKAPTIRNWNPELYACYVPHLMLYPNGGEVQVKSVHRVVLGDPKRYTV